MKHLYFVRHGLSVMNKKGFYSGRTEVSLAPEGIAQAEQCGLEAKDLNIDLIVSSPMERARETAAIMARSIGYPVADIVLNELFIEREFGVLEGTPYMRGAHISHHEGVETDEEILARVQKGLDYLRSLKHDNVLVVSHGAVGRALKHLLNPDVHFHDTDHFENAKIVQLL